MKVSVIVPVFNAMRYIDKCIDALLSQTYQHDNYEIIVVDDGSIDGTKEIVKRFPVRYIWQPNRGPAAARNHGAKEAAGEIIIFTDADCIPVANWIEEMVKPFNSSDVIAVKGAYKTSQTSLVARFSQIEFEERFKMLKRAKSIDMVDTYSAAFRKDIFWKAGGFDESFPVANNEDTELSYKLSRLGYKMVFNPDAIVYHINHPDSIRKYSILKFWRGYWRMVVYKRYPTKVIKDTYTPQTLKLQILFSFLILVFLPFTLFLPNLIFYPLILAIIFFGLSILPLTLSAIKKDLIVGILSPIFISIRAASIGLGVICGMISRMKI